MTEARDAFGRRWTADIHPIGDQPAESYSHLSAAERFALVGALRRRYARLATSGRGRVPLRVREGGILRDPLDLLRILVAHEVRFLVIGAHALAVHGLPRYTDDLDIWLESSKENAERAFAALGEFGAPLAALRITPADLTNGETVVQLGLPPNRIDLLSTMLAVGSFSEAWLDRREEVIDGLTVPFIGRAALLTNKRAVGRPQDLVDAQRLEALPPSDE